jgi:integrase
VPEVDFRDKAANKNAMAQAIRAKEQTIREITNKISGINEAVQKAQRPFTDWMQEYMEHVEDNGKDASWIRRTIVELDEFDSNIKLADVNRDFLVKFMDMLLSRKHKISTKKEHITRTTVFMYMDTLRAGLNYAVKEKVLRTSPYKLINRDMVSMDEHMRVYLTVEEVARLIKTPCKYHVLKQVFLFSCFTGLRIQDIRDLKWKHISKQLNVWQIEIIQFKTKKPLYLPLSLSARKWLPEQSNANPESAVFCGLMSYYGDALREWTQRAGITKDVTMHVGRHTFGTLCLTAGIDIYTTSQLMGHTTVRHTQRYAKIIDSKKDEAAVRLDKAFV